MQHKSKYPETDDEESVFAVDEFGTNASVSNCIDDEDKSLEPEINGVNRKFTQDIRKFHNSLSCK